MDMNASDELEVRALPRGGHRLRSVPRRRQVRPRGDRPGARRSRQRTRRRPAGPPRSQGRALAAAQEPRLATSWRGHRTREYRHAGYAAGAWRTWYRQAIRSQIAPLVRFARGLKPYLPGIPARCRWPLGTNLVQGINNKIKVSNIWPTASAMTPISSSRSGQHSPESGDEPI
jgi:transposase